MRQLFQRLCFKATWTSMQNSKPSQRCHINWQTPGLRNTTIICKNTQVTLSTQMPTAWSTKCIGVSRDVRWDSIAFSTSAILSESKIFKLCSINLLLGRIRRSINTCFWREDSYMSLIISVGIWGARAKRNICLPATILDSWIHSELSRS